MVLSVIIVNYRTADLTIQCLTSLEHELQPADRVVVVDNASGDGSADRIRQAIGQQSWADRVQVLETPRNLGFAGGNNAGIRIHSADAYLLLNSDTVVRENSISLLRTAMENTHTIGLVVPSLEHGIGNPRHPAVFRAPRPVSELIRMAETGLITRLLQRYDVVPKDDAPPDWVGFACVLIRREVIDAVGLLDEGFFMYFEDIDYCLKARSAGWQISCCPESVVVHFLGGSAAESPHTGTSARLPRFHYESRTRYFARYFGLSGLWLANVCCYAGWCVAALRQCVGNKPMSGRKRELRDIWVNAFSPFQPSSMGG